MGKTTKKEHSEIYKLLKDRGYELMEGQLYKNSRTKLNMLDSEGYKYMTSYDRIRDGCIPSRFGNGNEFTIDNIKTYIKLENRDHLDEIISTKYERSNKKLLFRCKVHNKEYEQCWSNYQSGSRCGICGNESMVSKNRLSIEYIRGNIKECDELISAEYIDAHSKLLLRCKIHNKIYKISWASYNAGHRCSKCGTESASNKIRLGIEDIRKNIGENDELISTNYMSANSKIRLLCKIHNEEYEISWTNYRERKRCPKCGIEFSANKKKLGLDYIKDNIRAEYDELISEIYENCHDKLILKCKLHSQKYEQSWVGYQSGNRGCPLCNSYKGEETILEYLKYNDIYYITQRKFEGLMGTGGGNLSYDFYLPDYKLLIEYQGEQHYKPVDFAGKGDEWANTQFKKQQEHDRRKRDFAQNNQMKLLEIPYWDFENIEDMLKIELEIEGGDTIGV